MEYAYLPSTFFANWHSSAVIMLILFQIQIYYPPCADLLWEKLEPQIRNAEPSECLWLTTQFNKRYITFSL